MAVDLRDRALALFNQWIELEDRLYLLAVDTLAGEYGWTVEYVQSLTLPEVTNLLMRIKERLKNKDLVDQINIAKGMSGKISPNEYKSPKKKESSSNKELADLKRLAKSLKLKVKEVK